MENIKKLIIVLIIILMISVILITLILMKKPKMDLQKEIEEFDEGLVFEDNDNGFQIVDDANMFFTVNNALSTYLQVESGYNDSYPYNVIPIDMRVKYGDNITTYITQIYLEDINNLNLEEKFYIVRMDSFNGTFSVEPVLEKTNEIDKITVKDEQQKIEENDYNSYYLETISIERLVKIYMDHFINMTVKHPEIVYNKYLHDEYKLRRFGNVEEFKKYIERNKEEIDNIRATKYLVENEGEQKKYVLMDQYENTYEFYETRTMSYKVKYDIYTILSDNYKQTYKSANEQKKVMMNVNRWINMLNNRDYRTAYDFLDETYRNNKFGSAENFEKQMRELFPSKYKVEYDNFSSEGAIYLQPITFKEIDNENSENINMTIIMKLLEETEFVMSYNIQ